MSAEETKRVTFSGEGFDRDDFSPTERAQIRDRNHHFDRNFLTREKFLEETGLKWVANMAVGFPAFLKVFVVISTIGASVLTLYNMGFFK